MVLHVRNTEETVDMHTLLKGAPVRDAIDHDIISRVNTLAEKGNAPKIIFFITNQPHRHLLNFFYHETVFYHDKNNYACANNFQVIASALFH